MTVYISKSHKDTQAFALRFALELPEGAVVALEGDLGAGKTAFVQGLAQGLGVYHPEDVTSPTYALMHVYEAQWGQLYHFDFYRIASVSHFESLGFTTMLGVLPNRYVIEWASRFAQVLPKNAMWTVTLTTRSARTRTIVCVPPSYSPPLPLLPSPPQT